MKKRSKTPSIPVTRARKNSKQTQRSAFVSKSISARASKSLQPLPLAVGFNSSITYPTRSVASGRHPKYGVETRFQGCELFASLTLANSTDGNTPGSIIGKQLLSPAAFNNTRLQQLAPLWERYRFNRVTIHFVPALGSNCGGQLVAYCDYDAADNLQSVSLSSRNQIVGNAMGSTECIVWQNMDTNFGYVDSMSDWYTDTAGQDDAEIRLQNQGQYWMTILSPLTSGISGTTISNGSGQPIGSVYVEYDISFFIPQLQQIPTSPSLEFNLVKLQNSYTNTAFENFSPFSALVGAYIGGDPGASPDDNRNQALASLVSFSTTTTSVTVLVRNYVGSLRWYGYASSADLTDSFTTINAADWQQYNRIMVNNGIAQGQLDNSSGNAITAIPIGFRDYPAADVDPVDLALSNWLVTSSSPKFVPIMEVNSTVLGGNTGSMMYDFRTVSTGGVTSVTFQYDSSNTGNNQFTRAYFSVASCAPPTVNTAGSQPTLIDIKAREQLHSGKHGKTVMNTGGKGRVEFEESFSNRGAPIFRDPFTLAPDDSTKVSVSPIVETHESSSGLLPVPLTVEKKRVPDVDDEKLPLRERFVRVKV